MIRAVVFIMLFLIGAFRGGYLIGWQTAIFFGILLALSAVILWDSFATKTGFDFLRRLLAICAFAFVAVFVFAPTLISPDLQYVIDRNANERKMRSELAQVFRSDSRFSSVHPEFTHLKCTIIKLRGSLPNESAFNEAQIAIGDKCPTVSGRAFVAWDVLLDDTGERVSTDAVEIGTRGTPESENAG